MKIKKNDHVGIIVEDMTAVKNFFLDFGLGMMGEGEVEGDWVERIIRLEGVRQNVVMMQTPDGGANIELVKFHAPKDEKGLQHDLANTLGIRHIAFAVEDMEDIVEKLSSNGTELIGEIQNYQNAYKLCYVRGPEGIILELAEKIES